MPLPLLVPIAIGFVGLFGTAKTGAALIDNNDANNTNSDAERLFRSTQNNIETTRVACNDSLAKLGQKKFDAVTKTLDKFVEVYGRIKNVELLKDDDMRALRLSDFDDNALQEMKSEVSMLASYALGIGSGTLAGAMTTFGAYSGTMMLGSASTGTAIGSLSGAAATNATMAWLGGGTLASGGMGIAGGVVVLGVMVAAPAFLVLGLVMGSKAEKKLNDAKSNLEEAKSFQAEGEVVLVKLNGIIEVGMLATQVLSKSRSHSRRMTKKLADIIEASGTDYGCYTDQEKAIVFNAVKLAQLVKAIVDTPILDEDGNLLNDVGANIKNIAAADNGL